MMSGRMRWAGLVAPMGNLEMHIEFLSESLKGIDHSEDRGVDGRIILEWI